MMLVAFWCSGLKLLQLASQHKLKDNKRNLCQDLFTIENTGSVVKVSMQTSYSKTFANSPNKQKQ